MKTLSILKYFTFLNIHTKLTGQKPPYLLRKPYTPYTYTYAIALTPFNLSTCIREVNRTH